MDSLKTKSRSLDFEIDIVDKRETFQKHSVSHKSQIYSFSLRRELETRLKNKKRSEKEWHHVRKNHMFRQ